MPRSTLSSRLHLPLRSPRDVVPHLGKGELHWKEGRSAYALVTTWFGSRGLPPSVRQILATDARFGSAALVDAFLERAVDLGDGYAPSQSDLVAVLDLGTALAVLTVEAKVDETFGPLVGEWLTDAPSRQARLRRLTELLRLDPEAVAGLRYQLLHRTAAAIYEAQRYHALVAVLLVQSSCPKLSGWADFQRFAAAMGLPGIVTGALSPPILLGGVELYLGWLPDRLRG